MRLGRNLLSRLIAALFLTLYWGIAGSQTADYEESWLPLAELKLADNGNLVGWKVGGLGIESTEILDTTQSLLALQLLSGKNDLSKEISWKRAPPDPDYLAEFVGTISVPPLEIRRSYKQGDVPGTLLHNVRILSRMAVSPNDFKLVLKVRPNLRFHRSNDRSLGDVFYSYRRIFAAEDSSKRYERVVQKQQVASLAFATRHVAVIVFPEIPDSTRYSALPESEATLTSIISEFPFTRSQVLAAKKLTTIELGGGKYRDLLYAEMLSPMRTLARAIEFLLHQLVAIFSNAGVAVVIFALIMRALMFPLNIWSTRKQQQFSEVQKRMKPMIEQINNTLRGAEKSERILEVYKEFGISPFSGLKGSVALFIQLPILIALFAVTTESAIFRDVSFLWAADISLPDRAARLPFSIPGLGGYLNIQPVLLGLISVLAAYIQSRSLGTKRVPRAGLLLALAFVVFFFSCATALVLYWIVVNVLQILETLYVRWAHSTRDAH